MSLTRMGLPRAIGTAAVLAGAFGAGLAGVPSSARAAGIEEMITPGSIAQVQLLGGAQVLTEEEATRMLRAEGFEVVEQSRTLLGRIRIVAEGPQGQREIVLHPGDGRVMRDILTEPSRPAAADAPAAAAQAAPDPTPTPAPTLTATPTDTVAPTTVPSPLPQAESPRPTPEEQAPAAAAEAGQGTEVAPVDPAS